MSKSGKITIFMVALIGLAALAFLGWHLSQAQVRVQGKPTPPPACNSNSACEYNEFNVNYSFETQPCLDCQPKNYPPLAIEQGGSLQVLGLWRNNDKSAKAFQFKWLDTNGDGIKDTFTDTWASDKFTDPGYLIYKAIGDIDRDGSKEIVIIRQFSYASGTKKNITYTYDIAVRIYKTGGTWIETPKFGLSEKPIFGGGVSVLLVDADGNGYDDDLLIDRGDYKEIYKYLGSQMIQTWESAAVRGWLHEYADSDNDGRPEIICANSIGQIIIWERDANFQWPSSPYILNTGASFVVDFVKVRDLDKDGIFELFTGGNNQKLLVFRGSDGLYNKIFESSDIGTDPNDLDVGDVNGDGFNEVVIVTCCDIAKLLVYNLDLASGNLTTVAEKSLNAMASGPITVKDLTGDGIAEIYVNENAFTIYKLQANGLTGIYNSAFGYQQLIK
jgi:FG-GAP-like repeat